jgi:hypothetical protein
MENSTIQPTPAEHKRELYASDIGWTLSPASAIDDVMLSDDDIKRQRDFYREALIVAFGVLHDMTHELERTRESLSRERDQHRFLREESSR